jgi:hypothetical protein
MKYQVLNPGKPVSRRLVIKGLASIALAITGQHITFYPTFPMFTLAWSPDDMYFAASVGYSSVQISHAP